MRSCGIVALGALGLMLLPLVLITLFDGAVRPAVFFLLLALFVGAWARLAATRYKRGGHR